MIRCPGTKRMFNCTETNLGPAYPYDIFDQVIDDGAFTMPNVFGSGIVNLGPAYEDPIRYTNGNYPQLGQLLIHELTHAWQTLCLGV
jgi:hypothetical protein